MKRKLLSVLLCCFIVLAFAPAAMAALKDTFTDGDYTFTKTNVPIDSFVKGGYRLIIDYTDKYPEDNVYFSEGFLLVYSNDTNTYNYLGTDGKLKDLNRGRFISMGSFSNGLAAVVDEKEKMGFIDTIGNLVIPCQFTFPVNQVFYPYLSTFSDGKAWIFQMDEGTDITMNIFGGKPFLGTWVQIDKSGKVLSGTEKREAVNWGSPSREQQSKYNIFSPDATAKGVDGFTEKCTAPGIGSFDARFGDSDTGLAELDTGKRDTYGFPELVSYVVTKKAKQALSFEVTDKDALLVDNGYIYDYTLKNNTKEAMKGYYALITYSPKMFMLAGNQQHFSGQAHRFEVNLAAGASSSGSMKSQTNSLSTREIIWVTFKDKAEQDAFFASSQIGESSDPSYEASFGYHYIKSENFMKDTFGITILPAK